MVKNHFLKLSILYQHANSGHLILSVTVLRYLVEILLMFIKICQYLSRWCS